MQVARKRFALVFLQVDVLLRQPLVFRKSSASRGVRRARMANCSRARLAARRDQTDSRRRQHQAGNSFQLQPRRTKSRQRAKRLLAQMRI